MIDVKSAVTAAMRFLTDLDPEAAPARLEEVERTEDDQLWLITLSYQRIEELMTRRRVYKLFRVAAATGAVLSMKIREVASS